MNHIVLLGDSIFDNGAYVSGGPAMLKQLRAILPPDFKATLLAVDGSVTTDVIAQISKIPASATHLIVSAGGNDGLSRVDILQKPARSVGDAVDQLAALRVEFCQNYRRMLTALLALKKPLAVCTVYDPNFPDPLTQRLTTTALGQKWLLDRARGVNTEGLTLDQPNHRQQGWPANQEGDVSLFQ